jgi:asparagine synthase (glutamine-hydrolysing)
MASTLCHRGPDAEGLYYNTSVGLVHRRLSIIDVASGQQPMASPDGKVCLVFNGEIYNYLDLRDDLTKRGYYFCTQSDTEVLLALYMCHGLEAFSKVNGMFACAFWDERSRQLILARDRFGKKPLFYYQNAKQFLFASELKAILAYGEIERQINPVALHEYFTYGYCVSEETMLAGIRRLPPAHVLVVNGRESKCQAYWELVFQPSVHPPSETEAVEHVVELIQQAVKRRLMSEVPLGAFLSGGLDSSVVVAMMAQLMTKPVQTFTIGFEESDYSELEDARIVARHLGTEHHEMIVKPSAFEILQKLVWYLDEPFGDSSAIPTYYVSWAARQHVTVALSGDGGDEVFAGYTRYSMLGSAQDAWRIPAWIRRGVVRPLVQLCPFTMPGWNYLYAMAEVSDDDVPYHLGLYPYLQGHLYHPEFAAQLRECDPFALAGYFLECVATLDPVSRYQYLDTRHYLPGDILTKVDRMSMANSLEVRAPLLDVTLVEYMATLPVDFKLRGAVSKYILRQACGHLLPPGILAKCKQGFAVPKDQWFQQDLYAVAEEILLDRRTLARGYFRAKTVKRLLRHHATGRRDYSTWIWCLIVFEMWCRLYLDASHT